MEENYQRILRNLPKFLEYKDRRYYLLILKKDWDLHHNSWQIFYAKEIFYGFSTTNPLIFIENKTFDLALLDIEKAVSDFRTEHKDDPYLTRR